MISSPQHRGTQPCATQPGAITTTKPGRLFRWQVLTVALMLVGYSGYYLCRSDFSVALPLIADELAARGLAPDFVRIRLGAIASLGVMAYAAGKFPAGAISDFFGASATFLAVWSAPQRSRCCSHWRAGCHCLPCPGLATAWSSRSVGAAWSKFPHDGFPITATAP